MATLEVLSINKPDETCTNADDQIIVLQHGGVASVDLDEFLEQKASDDSFRQDDRRVGGEDSLHDGYARLKRSAQWLSWQRSFCTVA